MTTDLAPLPEVLRPIEPIATHAVTCSDGTRLHVREWGSPDGQDVVFVHGWSQCDLCWAHQVRGSLAERFRLVTFDLRGHGRSGGATGPAGYADGDVWADDLAAVLQATSARRPVVVGWSYGGFVVADYLRAHGEDRISAIDLVGAAPRLRPPYEGIGPGLLDNVVDMCGADLLANIAATRRFIAACTHRPLSPAETETALAWTMAVPPEVREALRAREIDVADVYAATTVPVLVTHGREDAIVRPAMADELVAGCPTATASWYDGVGHAPFWEAPDRFDAELAALAHRRSR
jgi:pimeloyl-ACP methyl ester carboxylesterase